MDLSSISIRSERLLLRAFAPRDAQEAHAAATATLARYMSWDPAPSLESFEQIWRIWRTMMVAGIDAAVAVRLASTGEFLGMAGLHHILRPEPEVGIWIKETMHGHGFGREAVAAVVAFAAAELGKQAVLYPVAEQNLPSRRLAESLGGKLVGKGTLRKPSGVELAEVIYRIPTGSFPN
ncbi:MAG TPA: GNAT family protein [Xanthobacteraceae bacterium]|nr:GNAT family protein [Xanthobacteraceae bacterium]